MRTPRQVSTLLLIAFAAFGMYVYTTLEEGFNRQLEKRKKEFARPKKVGILTVGK